MGAFTKEKFVKEKKFTVRLKVYLKYYSGLLSFGFFFLILSGIFFMLKKPSMELFYTFINVLVIVVVLILLNEFSIKYSLIFSKPFDFRYFVLFVVVVMFLIYITFNVYREIRQVKIKKKYSGVEFKLDDKVVKSDNMNYYIGKTKNYLFFYQESDNKTIVYPMDRINELQFTNNP